MALALSAEEVLAMAGLVGSVFGAGGAWFTVRGRIHSLERFRRAAEERHGTLASKDDVTRLSASFEGLNDTVQTVASQVSEMRGALVGMNGNNGVVGTIKDIQTRVTRLELDRMGRP